MLFDKCKNFLLFHFLKGKTIFKTSKFFVFAFVFSLAISMAKRRFTTSATAAIFSIIIAYMLQNTVKLVLFLAVLLLNFGLDLIDILERILEASSVEILIFILQPINTALDIIIAFFTETILIAIGGFDLRRQIAYIISSLAEFIPIVDFLPLRTIGLIITGILMILEERRQEAEIREIETAEKIQSEELEESLVAKEAL